jgi:hypothetical protein
LVGTSVGKIALQIPKLRLKDNIKMVTIEREEDDTDWIHLAQVPLVLYDAVNPNRMQHPKVKIINAGSGYQLFLTYPHKFILHCSLIGGGGAHDCVVD